MVERGIIRHIPVPLLSGSLRSCKFDPVEFIDPLIGFEPLFILSSGIKKPDHRRL